MSTSGNADLAFVNGAVYTVDAARSWARAVAVRGGRIVGVGTDDDIRAHVGPATEVVDLSGRMLVPGFQDAHVHPVGGGLDMLQCDLHDLSTEEEYLLAIKTYAEEHPEREWILGGGWSMDVFPGGTPTKELLDALVPNRFVYLPNRDGHSTWVNSSALEQAGITRDTPDPADGRIERTDDGEPSGTLHEGAAELVGRHAPAPTGEEMAEALLKGQEYLHSLGITAWQDAIVDDHQNFGSNYRTYVDAAGRGDLTARVVGALWWDRHRGAEQIEAFVDMRERGRIGRFSPTSIKIMQDGVCENFTAAVIDPYLDAHGESTGNRGISFVDPEALKGYVTELDRLGFQVHYHALAERAVREALDAIEAALAANGASDNRHHLAHIQVVHPDDIPRFRRLHAVANAQPLWAAHESQMDDLTIPFLGEPRWRWQYPFASLVRAGATLAMGSDWSVSSPDPLEEIHVAVNRRMPPSYPHKVERHDVFIPDERLDLATALAAFTMGSAYVNHLDDTTGSIEVGKFADLTVIDRNPFEHPVEEIADATVEQTFVEGERVFEAVGS
ncbi:MAG TPA: amidohydrolase [Actinomycetota bacterium]|nr:amidohydrolase [Actinomycetota bacterium]